MHWRIELNAKEKQSLRIRFFVKYPRDERPEGI